MIDISLQPLAALSAQADNDFTFRLVQFLRDNIDDLADEEPEAILQQVKLLLEVARSYSLISESAIASYVITASYLGVDFDRTFPAAAAVLSANDLTEPAKSAWLESWTVQLFKELG